MKNEHVLVIDRASMDKVLGNFQGFKKNKPNHLEELLQTPQFVEREQAECDPSKKQLIPYCILTHQNQILIYQRGKSGGEKRLTAKTSIGIGGHINPIDFLEGETVNKDTYTNATLRELKEELSGVEVLSSKILGFINDDSNPVGSVHLGVIELLEVKHPNILPNEEAIQEPQFKTIPELEENKHNLENWSQIALKELKKVLIEESPSS